jgi:hypothetical protein
MIRSYAIVVAAIAVSAGVALAGPTAEQRCQQSKWKEQAKLEGCLKKNNAKLVGGAADGSAKCWAKFHAGILKADSKATALGTACRFVDNGDGTTSDLNTGLMWEQKTNVDGAPNPADPHDGDNQYTFSASGSAADGTAFTAFLAALNHGASTDGAPATALSGCFAGRCDWRLPSIIELQWAANPNLCGALACLDPAFGPRPVYSFYWTATDVSGDPSSAWDMRFGAYSARYPWGKLNPNWVRAVRGGLSSAPPAASVPTPTGSPIVMYTPIPTATPTGSVAPTATPTGSAGSPNGALCAANSQCTSGTCGVGGSGRCCAAPCSGSGICGATGCNVSGACEYPSAVTVAGFVAGDCQQLHCNGVGGTVSSDDPSDPPVSHTACLINPTCSGSPLEPHLTAAPAGTDCTADNNLPNHVCGSGLRAGECVECVSNVDCPGSGTCSNGVCF